jgi:hypothetical protein
MGLNPFASVSDYPSMLNKIALYTFGVTLLMALWLYYQVPALRPWMLPIEVTIPEFPAKIPLGVLFAAFVAAFLSRIFKLHDRISDMLGIRKRFDLEVILFPMASASGAALTLIRQEAVRRERVRLMSDVFYKYATSSPGKAVIEIHAITMALDQWSWYWIVLEADAVALLAAGILSWNGYGQQSSVFVVGILISVWALGGIRGLCSRYATDEIRQILLDPQRQQAVQNTFRAL